MKGDWTRSGGPIPAPDVYLPERLLPPPCPDPGFDPDPPGGVPDPILTTCISLMTRDLSRGPEILLPPSALQALAAAAASALPGAEEVLTQAGAEVGRTLHPQLAEDGAVGARGDFWDRLQRHLVRRGLGRFSHRRIHPGIGVLEGSGVAELEDVPGDREGRPFVPFTTGVLLGVLSAAAGRPVDLRLLGGTYGGSSCRWVFGSPAALDALERRLGRGATLEEAVADL